MKALLGAATLALTTTGAAMAEDQIRISSEWGEVTAELLDNAAAKSLIAMLPITLQMRDHLRQEKTGTLPRPLPDLPRQQDFSVGTLGIWSGGNFVIYYKSGRVPMPGIIQIGSVTGEVSIFDRPGPLTVRIEQMK